MKKQMSATSPWEASTARNRTRGLIWSLAAAFVAVRQGLDLDNTKALLTIIIGAVVILAITAVIGALFGVAAFGLDAINNAF